MGNSRESISFGPFQLFPAARAIEKNGVGLPLGSRALDILIVLVERAGEVVDHKALTARVWRDLVVSPGSLRVHMTALRKALDDDARHSSYISNVPGQGYCFIAEVRRETPSVAESPASSVDPPHLIRSNTVPAVLARMVGREESVLAIAAELLDSRFLTIVGPGGMGKTTVAVAVTHAMLEEFAGAVCFVDLGALSDPELVPATVASTLGLTIQSKDTLLPGLVQYLRHSRMLLVLDNCEHVVGTVAALAERIFEEAPDVHILATSRERLRAEGERAHSLPPLRSPPRDQSLHPSELLTFPTVKLFIERAGASGGSVELGEDDATVVAGICDRLDGIALAIEFAAGRVGSYGLEGTARLLNERIGLRWHGRRTALPRHQTLQALLDWSYGLLPEVERQVLRRLSIFAGTFTLEAARAVASSHEVSASEVVDAVDELVAKSLVSTGVGDDGGTRYRLLDTTRAYASAELDKSGEADDIALRHAAYFQRLLHATTGLRLEPCLEPRDPPRLEHLGNVRAALEWCFAGRRIQQVASDPTSASEDPARPRESGMTGRAGVLLAVELAAAAAPTFLDFSLLEECRKWSSAALALLDDDTRGGACEMVLQEALGISSTWTRGAGGGAQAAVLRGVEIARRLRDIPHLLRLLTGYHVYLVRVGEYRASLVVAEEMDGVARATGDPSCMVMSDWLLGSSRHFLGEQAVARQHFQDGFDRPGARNSQQFGLDYRVRALITFARVLWLTGKPDRAMAAVREAIAEAIELRKPFSICFAMVYAVPIFLWCGDLRTAQDLLARVAKQPNWHALPSLHATASGLEGLLDLQRGDAERAIVALRPLTEKMRLDRQLIMINVALCGLAEALAKTGRKDEAATVIADAIVGARRDGEALELSELLRVRSEFLLSMPGPRAEECEDGLKESLDCARRQSALAWELRTTMTLARLRRIQGRSAEGFDAIAAVHARFSEGFETTDLRSAALLMDELRTGL